MPAVTIRMDPQRVRQMVHALGAGMVTASKKALNRTAFEVIDGEKAHVLAIFDFAGASTRGFLAGRGSFGFDRAREERLRVLIFPRRKTNDILVDHEEGASFTVQEGGRLGLGTRYLAVPLFDRSGRGRVPKRQTPAALFTRGTGFTKPSSKGRNRVLFERPTKRQRAARARAAAKRGEEADTRDIIPLYVLVPRAKVAATFRFYDVAKAVAFNRFPTKLRQEFAKAIKRRGGAANVR